MTLKNKEKVLITFDGSTPSVQTAVYASKLRPLQKMDVTLFHVFDAIPDNYWDLEKGRQIPGSFGYLRAWESQRKKAINDHMLYAQELLLNAGFDPKQVHINIQKRKQGIARDIIQEAKQGYKMIITRRRGMGAIRSMVVGSVTSKILDSLVSIPILLAGQKTSGSKFLIAVDGSENSLKALDFAGNFLRGFGYQIGLLHVIRGGVDFIAGGMPMPIYTPEPFLKEAVEESKEILENARNRLVQTGFDAEQISTRTITGVASRASSIAEEAKKENFGTIILGRRGLSSVQEFLMGRVTKKVIHFARRHSVWIVT